MWYQKSHQSSESDIEFDEQLISYLHLDFIIDIKKDGLDNIKHQYKGMSRIF